MDLKNIEPAINEIDNLESGDDLLSNKSSKSSSRGSLASLVEDISLLRQSFTSNGSSNPFKLSDNGSRKSRRSSKGSPTTTKNVTGNKRDDSISEEETLFQIPENEIPENLTLEKIEKNKKISSLTNEILETIAENEEVADVDGEHLEIDELNLKLGDGKKAISNKEVTSKNLVENIKTAKSEKEVSVQILVTELPRPNDISNLSTAERKKSKFAIKDLRRGSQINSVIQHPSISIRSGLPHNLKRQTTYQLEPIAKFSLKDVEGILENCTQEVLFKMTNYDSCIAPQLAHGLATKIRKAVKEENYDRYRICVYVLIGENLMNGVHNNSQCLWDRKFDSFATHLQKKANYFVLSVCYGVYKE